MKQKLVQVGFAGGAYCNFFFNPGSIGSLARYLDDGWCVKFIKDTGTVAVVLLEMAE